MIRRLWPEVWRYRWRVGIALLFLVAAKLANIGVPLVLKKLVDALDIAPEAAAGAGAAAGRLRRAAAVDLAVHTSCARSCSRACTARTSRSIALRGVPAPACAVAALPPRAPTGGVARDIERGMRGDLGRCSTGRSTRSCRRCSRSRWCCAHPGRRASTGVRRDHARRRWSLYIAFTVLDHRMAHCATTARRTRPTPKANARAVDSLLNYETVKYFGNERFELGRYDESLQQLRERDGQEPEDAVAAQHRPGQRSSRSG